MRFFYELWYEVKYLLEEILIKAKHPTRNCEVGYHFSKIMDILFFHPWYCLKRGIRNLFVWFKLIWCNDVFDHCFLVRIMDKQLKEMEDFWISGKTHTCGANHVAKRIKWTRKLIEMSMDDYYSMKAFTEYENKCGKTNFEHVVSKVDEYGIPVLYEMKSDKTQEDHEIFRQLMKDGVKKDEKVWKLAIKNLSRMKEWWD